MKDFTKGNILHHITVFALPLFASNLLQLTYSFADTRMVGEFVGEDALAAVGSTNPLNTLIVGFLVGMTNGFAVITAWYFGAHNNKGLKKAAAAAYILGLFVSFVLTAVSLLLLKPMLWLLHTPEAIMGDAYRYISIIFAGMTISMLYNICSAVLRAIGDTVTPLVILAISAGANIALDYLCMVVFHWGVSGAAFATLASQALAFFICLLYSYHKYEFIRFSRSDCHPDAGMARKMLSSGLSMGLMNSVVSLGTVCLQGAINTLGASVIVAHTAARKISELFMMPFGVFGMTMATFCGQNSGAGKLERVKDGLKDSVLMAWGFCLIVIAASWLFGRELIYLVTGSKDDAVLATGTLYLRVDTLFYFVPAVISIFRNGMQGLGDHITPIVSSFIELVGKVLVVFFLVPGLRYTAVIMAEPIVWFVMVIPLIVRMRRLLWVNESQF